MLAGLLTVLATFQGVTLGPPLPSTPRKAVVQQGGDGAVLGALGAEDANEIEVAKLAISKASNSDAKAYATQLLHDHQESLTSGTKLAKRYGLTRVLPADSAMARAHAKEMTELNVLSGATFDKSFMQFEVDGHVAAIAKDSALIARATRAPVKAFVRSLLPIHSTHHDIAVKWLAAHP